jgi:hypothetical protein
VGHVDCRLSTLPVPLRVSRLLDERSRRTRRLGGYRPSYETEQACEAIWRH